MLPDSQALTRTGFQKEQKNIPTFGKRWGATMLRTLDFM